MHHAAQALRARIDSVKAEDGGDAQGAVALIDRLDAAISPGPVGDAAVTFDQLASPWYTVVVVRAEDRAGLLHDVTAALAGAGARIHAARVRTVGSKGPSPWSDPSAVRVN